MRNISEMPSATSEEQRFSLVDRQSASAPFAVSGMRIVICDYGGYPFPVELSRALSLKGHSVLHMHFADLAAPKGNLRVVDGDSPSFQVVGITAGRPFDKRKYFRRLMLERKFGELAAKQVLSFRPDVVVGCNMPLDAQKKLQRAALSCGAAFVFWIQDVMSHAARHYLSKQFGVAGELIGKHYERLERSLLRSSHGVVAISEKFRPALDRFGVDASRVSVIANWAPLSEIEVLPKDNDWARRHDLWDVPVALYTGTLKLMENPSLLLDLAVAAQPSELRVVVIAMGAGADWLAQKKREHGLQNLIILPFQPIEEYGQVLATADVLVATLDPAASAFSVPSKVLSYLAAGRPIVASINAENDAAQTIITAEAGFVVDPERPQGFVDRTLSLAADVELRATLGRNARRYAEKHFAIGVIADRFEEVLSAARSLV